MDANTLLLAGGGSLALLALPLVLPKAAFVERRRFVAADAQTVFALLSSNAGFQRFNPFKDADPELKITLTGPVSGVGSAFRFEGRRGSGTQTIVGVERNREVTAEVDMGAMGKSFHRFRLTPADDGTEVVWRAESRFGFNPLGRVFGLFMERFLGPVFEKGLGNLDRAVTTAA
jgi:carbon monoxide dehydrogenase subunit G